MFIPYKVPGTVNPLDMGTKNLPGADIKKFLPYIYRPISFKWPQIVRPNKFFCPNIWTIWMKKKVILGAPNLWHTKEDQGDREASYETKFYGPEKKQHNEPGARWKSERPFTLT